MLYDLRRGYGGDATLVVRLIGRNGGKAGMVCSWRRQCKYAEREGHFVVVYSKKEEGGKYAAMRREHGYLIERARIRIWHQEVSSTYSLPPPSRI